MCPPRPANEVKRSLNWGAPGHLSASRSSVPMLVMRLVETRGLIGIKLMGTSNNCPRSSGTPNLPANDSALFSFRFCAVHPKDARDCLPRQLFEVPYSEK